MGLNEYSIIVSNLISENIENLILCVVILSVLTLILFIIISFKLSSITRKYTELTTGVEGKNLEDILLHQAKSLKNAQNEIIELKQLITQLKYASRQMINKVYPKRYNAFPDMGSDLSFSVVFLNGENTGIIMTSIYGRDENRIYLKPITKGKSTYTLSPEEQEIINEAVSK